MVDYIDWLNSNADWLVLLVIITAFTIYTIRYFVKFDEYEKEPKFKLILAFVYGILSVIPSIILSLLLDSLTSLDTSVFIAPVAEEIGKGLFIVWMARSSEFDGPLDGMVYGGLIGAGFAGAENMLYAYSALTQSGVVAGIITASFRSVFQIVGHPFFSALMGYGVGAAKVGEGFFKWGGIWQAMLAHGIWNFSASYSFIWLIVLGLIFLWFLKRKFSEAKKLDKDAFERGYYSDNNVPYIANK